MTSIHDIDAALQTLDVADPHVDPASPRARADLKRILATATSPAPLHQRRSSAADRHGAPRSVAWSAHRFALAGGVLAAVAGGIVALPALTGGDQAFASWTGVPQDMTTAEREDAANSCRQMQEDGVGGEYADDVRTAEPDIAERRGGWTTVVLAGTDGFSAMCISDDSTHLFSRDAIGSIGTPAGHAAPQPRELVARDLGTGTMSAGDLSLAADTAGPAVVGVTYHSSTHASRWK